MKRSKQIMQDLQPDEARMKPIESAAFYEGMYIDSYLYYRHDGKYILLCENATLDTELIAKLRRVAMEEKRVYVNVDHYESIMQQSHEFAVFMHADPPPAPAAPKKPAAVRALTAKERSQQTKQGYEEKAAQVAELLHFKEGATLDAGRAQALSGEMQEKIRDTDAATLLECISLMRTTDDYLYSHSCNVAYLNGLMGKWLKLPDADIQALIETGLLHDVGKLKIPSKIINKPDKLTKLEYELIKFHPVESEKYAKQAGITDGRILSGIRHHHERMNGTGYPDRLQSDQISQFARITAITDIYDAMIAKKSYREQFSPFEVLDEFAKSRFSDLDIGLIDLLLKNMPSELIGRHVMLSNRQIGVILYVSSEKPAFPIVRVMGKTVITNPELKVLYLTSHVSLFEE